MSKEQVFRCTECGAVTQASACKIDEGRRKIMMAAATFVATFGIFGTKSKAPVPEEIPVGVTIDQRTRRPKMDMEVLPETRYVDCGCGAQAFVVTEKPQATA